MFSPGHKDVLAVIRGDVGSSFSSRNASEEGGCDRLMYLVVLFLPCYVSAVPAFRNLAMTLSPCAGPQSRPGAGR